MNRRRIFPIIVMLMLSALLLTACGKSEFGVTGNTDKWMTITAERADKDAFFMLGTLKVEDGEQIVISSNLTKGSVRVEIVSAPEEQLKLELLAPDAEAVITANLGAGDGASGTVPAGSYYLRATGLERATGTITIDVTPAP